jgi:hypothetical protein
MNGRPASGRPGRGTPLVADAGPRPPVRPGAGYDEAFIDDVARVMEYTMAHEAYRDDRETTTAGPSGGS